jgi:hypothetical protein
MSLRHFIAFLAIATSLAACQTISGGPSPSAVAFLESQGFKPATTADLNKDLAADDIRTVAAYECDKPRCRSDVMMIFGVDPTPESMLSELDKLRSASPAAQSKLIRTVLGPASGNYFVGISGSSFVTPDGGKGVRISGQVNPSKVPGLLRNERFHIAMTYVYRSGAGRVVIAVAGDSATAARYASADLLR